MPTTYWAPNQAAIAQVETYTFTAPSGIGNHYKATINGKTVTYASVSGDTAITAATALFNLLNISASIAPELLEIQFANPSDGVVTATAKVPGTPFANVAGTSAGLVLSTGNGLANGITTVHTTPSASPSDVNDAQNWLRVTPPAPPVRAIPQNGDDVVVANSEVPLLWNLAALAAVRFNTYTRWQSFTGAVGLPERNTGGYTEWRETYFLFSGPSGSVPTGGLQMILGYDPGGGSGPSRERYNVGSQKTTLTCLAGGSPTDGFGVRFLGVHTENTFTALNVSLGIAVTPGEISSLSSSKIDGGAVVEIGTGVTWTAGSVLTTIGGEVVLGAAPATINGSTGTRLIFPVDGLTWSTITLQGNCIMSWQAGGTITNLTMSQGCSVDKQEDARPLVITNHTIDGNTCFFNDPLNAITYTNAGTVRQQVAQGPYRFTGSRTVKVT